MGKNGSRLTFVEKKKKSCFLMESVIDEALIENFMTESNRNNGRAPAVSSG